MSRVKTDKADSYYNSKIWKNVFWWRAYKPKPDVEKEIEVKLKILEDLKHQLTMLRYQMENKKIKEKYQHKKDRNLYARKILY
jgi:hypothetical protein